MKPTFWLGQQEDLLLNFQSIRRIPSKDLSVEGSLLYLERVEESDDADPERAKVRGRPPSRVSLSRSDEGRKTGKEGFNKMIWSKANQTGIDEWLLIVCLGPAPFFSFLVSRGLSVLIVQLPSPQGGSHHRGNPIGPRLAHLVEPHAGDECPEKG